jgi:hypothetical protein
MGAFVGIEGLIEQLERACGIEHTGAVTWRHAIAMRRRAGDQDGFQRGRPSDADRSRARATSSPAAPATKGAAKLVPVALAAIERGRTDPFARRAERDVIAAVVKG